MPCNKPVKAIRDSDGVRFVGSNTMHNLTLPCGQCWGCRLEKSRQWAVRCMHEAKMHEHNSFLTLTYNDDALTQKYWTGLYRIDGTKAYGGTLHYRDIVLFHKRLLKALSSEKLSDAIVSDIQAKPRDGRYGGQPPSPRQNRTFRFYLGGEYGEQYMRPHWHECIFGLAFHDKTYIGKSPAGERLYESPTLQKLWPHGFSSIGEVTFESAAYVARYIMKKINGKQAEKHYEKIDMETGEIIRLHPEFNNMSRSQGIGLSFFEKYYSDMYPEGIAIVRGAKSKTPRYYDKKFKERDPVAYEALEYDRHIYARQHMEDLKPQRLAAREKITVAKINQLKRTL